MSSLTLRIGPIGDGVGCACEDLGFVCDCVCDCDCACACMDEDDGFACDDEDRCDETLEEGGTALRGFD